MTAKEFLFQAFTIDKTVNSRLLEIERLQEQRERIRARLEAGRVSNLSGMPRGGGSDWTDSVSRATEIDKKLEAAIDNLNVDVQEMCRVKRIIAEAIDSVDEARYRLVLEYRYRDLLKWEDVAAKMGYELRQTFNLHGEALLRVKVPDEFA